MVKPDKKLIELNKTLHYFQGLNDIFIPKLDSIGKENKHDSSNSRNKEAQRKTQ